MINGRAELEKQMSPCQPGKITRQIVSQLRLWGKTMELSALRIDDDKGWPSYKFQVRICVILWSEHSRAVKRKENNNTTPSSSSSLLVLWGDWQKQKLVTLPRMQLLQLRPQSSLSKDFNKTRNKNPNYKKHDTYVARSKAQQNMSSSSSDDVWNV